MVPKNSRPHSRTIGFAFYCQVPIYKEVLAFEAPLGCLLAEAGTSLARASQACPTLQQFFTASAEGGREDAFNLLPMVLREIYLLHLQKTRPGLPVPYLQLCVSEATEKASAVLGRDAVIQPWQCKFLGGC